MSEELCINQNLSRAEFYLKHLEEDLNYLAYSQKCIDECERILKQDIRQSLISFSQETIIKFAETAIKVKDRSHLSEEFVNYFFQRHHQIGQFYVRAQLLRAKIIMNNGQKHFLKAEEMVLL